MTDTAICCTCGAPTALVFVLDTPEGPVCEPCDLAGLQERQRPGFLGAAVLIVASWCIAVGSFGCSMRSISTTRLTDAAATRVSVGYGLDGVGLAMALVGAGLAAWAIVRVWRTVRGGLVPRLMRVAFTTLAGIAVLLCLMHAWHARPHSVQTVTPTAPFRGMDGQPL